VKSLGKYLVVFSVTGSLLFSMLFFSAVYFFIGKNLAYMSKTQDRINNEIIAVLNGELSEGVTGGKTIEKTLLLARQYNVGIRFTDETGREITWSLDPNYLYLRLEFGGRLVTREFELSGSKGKVELTYFRPFLSSDYTIKFYPAFWRLMAMISVFSAAYFAVTAAANAFVIKKEIRDAGIFVSNLVKGSFMKFTKQSKYEEFQGILKDLAALQEIMVKKEQLQKRMTADFAHELRTPLTTLQSHLEALIEGVWEPTTERFESCHEEILRLIRLVGDLEKLSKIEVENIVLNKTVFNLTELVRSISLNFQGELNQKKIDLILSGEVQEMYADRDKLSQVLVNLLSNSIKYTPMNGRILVDVKGDEKYVYMTVNDSGMGIPAGDLPNVFNRLYRSDASRARETGGTGIGLTIARSIVESHRGSIDIVSQEGLGTEITVIIPRK